MSVKERKLFSAPFSVWKPLFDIKNSIATSFYVGEISRKKKRQWLPQSWQEDLHFAGYSLALFEVLKTICLISFFNKK